MFPRTLLFLFLLTSLVLAQPGNPNDPRPYRSPAREAYDEAIRRDVDGSYRRSLHNAYPNGYDVINGVITPRPAPIPLEQQQVKPNLDDAAVLVIYRAWLARGEAATTHAANMSPTQRAKYLKPTAARARTELQKKHKLSPQHLNWIIANGPALKQAADFPEETDSSESIILEPGQTMRRRAFAGDPR